MTIHFHYLNHHLSRQLNELYINTVIFAFGQSMLLLFLPIYFYKLGFGLLHIFLYYALHYAMYSLFVLLVGKITARIGYENSIGIAMPFYGLFLGATLLTGSFSYFFYISSVIWAFYKAFYWPAFHADFAKFSKADSMGEEVGSWRVLVGLVSIIGPTVGGFLIAKVGFNYVFLIVLVLSFISLIPLLKSKEKYDKEKFSIKTIVSKFFHKKYRGDVIANFGTGEDVIAQAAWPIFLITVLDNYQDVGILTTIALFVSFIIILVVGKLSNQPKRKRLIKITSSIVSLSWLSKILAFNWLSIFATDSLYKISKRTLLVPIQALIYSRPGGKNLLEYLSFREIALSISKTVMALGGALVIYYTDNILITFALAGIITLFYFYWTDQLIDNDKTITLKLTNNIK